MRAALIAMFLLGGCEMYFGPSGGNNPDGDLVLTTDGGPVIDAPPVARPPEPTSCSAVKVYLDLDGGTFSPGVADARASTSPILTHPATFAPVAVARGQALAARIHDALDFYWVPVTTTRPADSDQYIEVVLSGDGLGAAFPGRIQVTPSSCTVQTYGLGFVDSTVADDIVVASALASVGHLIGFQPTSTAGDCMNRAIVAGCVFNDQAMVDRGCVAGSSIQPESSTLASTLGCPPPQ